MWLSMKPFSGRFLFLILSNHVFEAQPPTLFRCLSGLRMGGRHSRSAVFPAFASTAAIFPAICSGVIDAMQAKSPLIQGLLP